jgi:predicted RND superfamily exporter protein
MKKFGEFILKYQTFLLITIVFVTVFFSLHVPKLRVEVDEKTWFSREDPLLEAYLELDEIFTGSEFAVIAYESNDIFNESEITYLSFLSQELENVPHLVKVSSLATVDDIVGTEIGLEIKPLIKDSLITDDDYSSLKNRIDLNPFYKGNLISNDGKTIGIVLSLDYPEEEEKTVNEITGSVSASIKKILQREYEKTGRRFYLGGSIITESEVASIMERDIRKFFLIAIALIGVILFLIFRSLLCIIFPLLTVFLTLTWTLGLKGILNSPITPLSTTLFALISVIGIADSVHLISHYHTELPCLFTSLTTAVGFSSLRVSSIPSIQNLGIFASFGIMMAFILSMILVPVGLQFMKTDFNITKRKTPKKNILGWIGAFNLKYPRWILVLGLSIIPIMGMGIFRIHVEPSLLEHLKKNSRLRQDAEYLDEKLSGISSIEVMLSGEPDSFKDADILRKIEDFQKKVTQLPDVSVSYSLVEFVKLINRAIYSDSPEFYKIPETREAVAQSLLLYEMAGGTEIEDYVTLNYDKVRISMRTKQMTAKARDVSIEEIEEYTDKHFKSFQLKITGFDKLVHKVNERIALTQVKSFGLAFLIILAIMFILFGLRGGLASILPNIFPIIFILGLMGYAGFHLHIASAMIASMAIGIVVDDTIHYFTHFKYEFRENKEGPIAMLNALQKVGPALSFTSIILVLGFCVFLLSETSILIDFGILSSIAVVVALLGDLVIGPTLLVRFNVFNKGKNKERGRS